MNESNEYTIYTSINRNKTNCFVFMYVQFGGIDIHESLKNCNKTPNGDNKSCNCISKDNCPVSGQLSFGPQGDK